MSKIAKKRINETEYQNPKKIKKSQGKKEDTIDFDAINKLIVETYPKLDTKNLELIKFLTIFDILFEKANKNNQTTDSEKYEEEIDSVDGLPEIIKIVCKTLLHILSESLNEIKLPLNIKKILIKLKKLLKITENGEDKKSKKSSSSSSSESASESTPITFSDGSEKTSSSSEKTTSSN